MNMTERQVGRVTILDLGGTITIDEDAARLRAKIDSLIVQERTAVILNLQHISYIDSGGLGQLLSCHGSLAKTNGGLKLLHVNQRNQHLLSITRLVTVFNTFDSEEEALRSFPEIGQVEPMVAMRSE